MFASIYCYRCLLLQYIFKPAIPNMYFSDTVDKDGTLPEKDIY